MVASCVRVHAYVCIGESGRVVGSTVSRTPALALCIPSLTLLPCLARLPIVVRFADLYTRESGAERNVEIVVDIAAG